VPGRQAPFVVALVRLTEGVRMVGELLGAGPGQVRIGMPVRAEFVKVDSDLTLPCWRQAEEGPPPEARKAPQGRPPAREARKQSVLPELVIDVTPTFVIAAAIATRDFQDVHHDRDLAVARGGKDIFINILTTTGLVQRYVTDWAGPGALVRQIDIRLGAPCYAGDTLAFSGRVVRAGGLECAVEVTGRCALGDHVTGTVRVGLPEGGGGREARRRGKKSAP
jgi:acyl dehydratase